MAAKMTKIVHWRKIHQIHSSKFTELNWNIKFGQFWLKNRFIIVASSKLIKIHQKSFKNDPILIKKSSKNSQNWMETGRFRSINKIPVILNLKSTKSYQTMIKNWNGNFGNIEWNMDWNWTKNEDQIWADLMQKIERKWWYPDQKFSHDLFLEIERQNRSKIQNEIQWKWMAKTQINNLINGSRIQLKYQKLAKINFKIDQNSPKIF